MLNLPVELLEIIFSFVDREGIRALFQVSRFVRELTLRHLLSRYHLRMADVHSGIINLPPGAHFLLPIIYSISPIQELIIPAEKRRLARLVSILHELPPIPQVLIRGHIYATKNITAAALIAALSRNGRDPVVLVGLGKVTLSLPRRGVPLRRGLWLTPLPEFRRSSLAAATEDLFWGSLLALPFVLVLIIASICNVYVTVEWLWRRCFTPPLNQVARIMEDLGAMTGNSMHIQTLFASANQNQFTLVTFAGDTALQIPRIPRFSRAMSTAVIRSLDLGYKLRVLTVGVDAEVDLSALLSLIHRHDALTELTLKTGALHSRSYSAEPLPPPYLGQIDRVATPAVYVPHLLRVERRLTTLIITPAPGPRHLSRALVAISAHPGPLLSVLTLYLRPPAHNLPWRVARDVEAESASHSIRRLILNVALKFTAQDVESLPRWLGRFPALVHLEIRGGAVNSTQQPELREAIAATYTGITGTGLAVTFFL
ncbi:hypothetical protein C8F04DRAFT_1107322 [Mycena alexandri]|uniref:F-box domain-containing protein n=1 Tax=Mycena alexandri TaxID=1745969 RepID=A0AAD6SRW6_9AGAR|nr:hypothetical protein C8F04DRAFT_1107322 [Mycena alexandri]